MDNKTDKIIRDYISFVATTNSRFLKAYLFGSYAKHTEKPSSDIDIAFIIEGLKDDERFDTQVQLMLQASDFDLRIEPHPISSSDLYSGYPFISEIIKTGIEIKLQS